MNPTNEFAMLLEESKELGLFSFTRHGSLQGTVVSVGQDAVQDEVVGPVYPVRIRIDRNDIRVDDREVRLSSGMAASVEVRTGERRILDFLLSPVARAANESLRERCICDARTGTGS